MDEAQRRWIEARRSQLAGKRTVGEATAVKYTWVKGFGGGITVSCDRRRYVRVDESDFKMRYISLRFSHVGMPDTHASFFEWDASDHPVMGSDFVDVADSRSQEDYEMAAIVEQCWSEAWEHPLDYGSIVVFHRLVIPRPMPAFWPTMRSAIKREFSRRAAMMLLKAFPLEWENRFQDPAAPGRGDFECRLNAMLKHYSRQLGVSRLPVSSANGQWMWLPHQVR
ncbi:hypothetical protein [Rhizobium sp. WSM1325]|uniref:hypothetical protein n=1 Tax=Rhizobium sp. WSM1325 TaxID=3444086 RepID=UPI000FF84C13|nr:hypothetical protein [Rhizobium leguminosarum]RWY70032.1 hypothetical protein EHI48_27080 [Rhizobium leguminosarum]